MNENKTVFVIDDDLETLEVISLVLKDSCNVYTFQQGDEKFFKFLKKTAPDVVIIDFPLVNIDEILKSIKDIYNGSVKIILISGYTTSQIPPMPLVDIFLPKPFLIIDLKELID